MANRPKKHEKLLGLEARSLYLTYIFNKSEAIARTALLEMDHNTFHKQNGEMKEWHHFHKYVAEENRAIQGSEALAKDSLDEIIRLGESFASELPGPRDTPLGSNFDVPRHMPVLSIASQNAMWEMVSAIPHRHFVMSQTRYTGVLKNYFAAPEVGKLIEDFVPLFTHSPQEDDSTREIREKAEAVIRQKKAYVTTYYRNWMPDAVPDAVFGAERTATPLPPPDTKLSPS